MAWELSKVKRIDFEQCIGPYSMKYLALFNSDVLSDDDAKDIINRGEAENCSDMIVCTERQLCSVFGLSEDN